MKMPQKLIPDILNKRLSQVGGVAGVGLWTGNYLNAAVPAGASLSGTVGVITSRGGWSIKAVNVVASCYTAAVAFKAIDFVRCDFAFDSTSPMSLPNGQIAYGANGSSVNRFRLSGNPNNKALSFNFDKPLFIPAGVELTISFFAVAVFALNDNFSIDSSIQIV